MGLAIRLGTMQYCRRNYKKSHLRLAESHEVAAYFFSNSHKE